MSEYRFFFDLHECGRVTPDREGKDYPDLDTAITAAIEAAREIMCAEVSDGRLCLSCHIDILDEQRQRVHTMKFRDAVVITGLDA